MQTLQWIAVLATVAVVAAAVLWWQRQQRKPATLLPADWPLTARPVFSTDERRVYRQLREALPHHIVLSKLPLVRFCQPNDPEQVRYWYELLGSAHVTFAICSANGRVLAAIDLDTERAPSRRVAQIKQAVLAACRVRYLRCPVDNVPSVAELQLLVPGSGAARGPQPAPAYPIHKARDALATTVAMRRRERATLWQDSTFFHDSFFSPDSRLDATGANSAFAVSMSPTASPPRRDSNANDPSAEPRTDDDSDLGGVVVDSPRYTSGSRR